MYNIDEGSAPAASRNKYALKNSDGAVEPSVLVDNNLKWYILAASETIPASNGER